MVDCSVWKAVDRTHFLRNLIGSDLAHQDYNGIVKDRHCRAHRFDLYLELLSIFLLFLHLLSRNHLILTI